MKTFSALTLTTIAALLMAVAATSAMADGSVLKKRIGVSGSNQYDVGVIAQLGMDVSDVLEVGAELGITAPSSAITGGLYAKTPLGTNGYYAIAGISRTEWASISDASHSQSASIGAGMTFKNGGFIEARTGIMKKAWRENCVNGESSCVAGGATNSPLITVTIGMAF